MSTRRAKIANLGLISLLWLVGFAHGQGSGAGFQPGDFQTANPYYPKPNPFFFEGKIDYEKLKITSPQNAWEFMQRGMHFQDDLKDNADALLDYQTALSMNSLQNATCQIVTSATLVNGKLPSTLNPKPCMFTLRLRLAFLLRQSSPVQAIALYQEVLQIDPLRLGVNELIGETYEIEASQTTDPTTQQTDHQNAVQALQAELALSPVTPTSIAQTSDMANNAHVHWELADVYGELGMTTNEISELNAYLEATRWHSDVYPWRISLAQKRLQTLRMDPRGKSQK